MAGAHTSSVTCRGPSEQLHVVPVVRWGQDGTPGGLGGGWRRACLVGLQSAGTDWLGSDAQRRAGTWQRSCCTTSGRMYGSTSGGVRREEVQYT